MEKSMEDEKTYQDKSKKIGTEKELQKWLPRRKRKKSIYSDSELV